MNTTTAIHRLEIRQANGARVRILAYRYNVDGPYADFEICVIFKPSDGPAFDARAILLRFPRGRGVDGLFAMILGDLSLRTMPAIDEDGDAVPIPEPTGDDYYAAAVRYMQLATACWNEAKKSPRKSGELHNLIQIFARHEEIDAEPPGKSKLGQVLGSVLPSMRDWAEKHS